MQIALVREVFLRETAIESPSADVLAKPFLRRIVGNPDAAAFARLHPRRVAAHSRKLQSNFLLKKTLKFSRYVADSRRG